MERLRNLEEKIADAVHKVRLLKEENAALGKKVVELEGALIEKDEEIRRLASEKTVIREQIEDLLGELETIGAE